MKRISQFFLASLLLCLMSCGEDKGAPKPIDPAFTNYVKGFTAGVISNRSTIKIKLTEAYQNAKKGENLQEELFSFSPDLEGKAIWLDKYTIEFLPSEKLPSGVIYDAVFELGELQAVPEKLSRFEFRFQVMTQNLFVAFEGMEAYKDDDLKWQQLFGTLQTSDYTDLEELQKTLSATQNGKVLNISWEFNEDNPLIYRFKVDSVARKETEEQVILAWNGEPIQANVEEEEEIVIPALGDFKVMSVNTEQLPEQKITVHFSDPLDKTQNLEGLIYTKEADVFRLRKERNAVYLYPNKNLSGSRTLIVSKGVKNSINYSLKEALEKKLSFSSMKPEVAFIDDGNILPSSNGFKLPIRAVNLSGLNVKVVKVFEENVNQFFQVNALNDNREIKRVGRIIYKKSISLVNEKVTNFSTWNTFQLDLTNMIKVEPGAIYRISIGFDQSQSLYPCEDEPVGQKEYKVNERDLSFFDSPNEYYWDYYDDYYEYDSEYRYKDRNNPCKPSYYKRGNHRISKNVLASDIGIIAKGGDKNQLKIALTNLKTSETLSGATIEIYNFQQKKLGEVKTDQEGLAELQLSGKPFLLIAKVDEQRGYLKLDDGSALSLSMFDVGGERNTKGVKGSLYGERGVWRPGDSLFLTFILNDKEQIIPQEHPLIFELYTPNNQLYAKIVKTNSLNGFYDLRTKTEANAPTGNWQAKVKLGSSSFYKRLKIEAIKPNRLKIKLDFEEDILRKENRKGVLASKWLHGADAEGLRATIEMNLSGGKTSFEGHEDYRFDDPSRKFNTEEEIVFDGVLNTIGEQQIELPIEVLTAAPGMLDVALKTRVFEKGGDFSVDRFKTKYSPYTSYVGVKIPKGPGWNGALFSDESNLIPIVTVDEQGNPIDRKDLKVEIYDIEWRWWWERNRGDDLARFVNNRSKNLVKTTTVSTKDGKALFQLDFNGNRHGRKLIRVTDPISGHVTGAIFYVTYKSWWDDDNGSTPGGAEMLSFTTDKKQYAVGESIQLNLPKIKEGRLLVSVESGSEIIDLFWKNAADLAQGLQIQTTEDMQPNIFIHLSLVQPHANTANDLPIRMYGVQNVSVESSASKLNPQLTMPDELAPEQEVNIKITEQEGKAMTYTIALVDEGLLDLTRFKTPDPWRHFHKKDALGIKTWDLYKHVMGAFSGEISGLLALGGDDALEAGEGNKANRFEPVVRFIGPFELKEGEERSHKISIPNYVGSVRTMLVAGNQEGAYGSTEKTSPVKKPLMVLSTLPRLVSPSEQVTLPVTVFAMDEAIQKVKVKVEANELIEVEEDEQEINFNKLGDQLVYFKLKVRKGIGIAKVKVIVEGNGEQATHETELEVRLPNPQINKTQGTVIEAGQTWSGTYAPIGIKGTNSGALEVSTVPSLNLEKRMNYLLTYPHGCVEQTTSIAFPQLFLGTLMKLSSNQKSRIQSNVTESLNRLRDFQLAGGGLSYWPGNTNVDEFGTSYAGHFMIEAKKQGYILPTGMFESWLKYQSSSANSWQSLNPQHHKKWYRRGHELRQAYRLYTLALAGKPAMGAMNRLREETGLQEATKWKLAAAYLLANKKEEAQRLIGGLSSEGVEQSSDFYAYGSRTRDQAMILETLELLGEKLKGKELMESIAEQLSSDAWMSTQTTAYSLLAISKFVKAKGSPLPMKFELNVNGKLKTIDSDEIIEREKLQMKAGKVEITNKTNRPLFVQLNLSGVPLQGAEVDEQSRLEMNVNYLNLDGTTIDPTKIVQGTDFMAEVSIKHPGGTEVDYKEMALTQLFPSGWEIRNFRMDETSSTLLKDQPEYQDIRDDRVYTYFDLDKNRTKTFRILLNAAYLGEFYLPAVECEAMYNNNIRAIKSGKWVEVISTSD